MATNGRRKDEKARENSARVSLVHNEYELVSTLSERVLAVFSVQHFEIFVGAYLPIDAVL